MKLNNLVLMAALSMLSSMAFATQNKYTIVLHNVTKYEMTHYSIGADGPIKCTPNSGDWKNKKITFSCIDYSYSTNDAMVINVNWAVPNGQVSSGAWIYFRYLHPNQTNDCYVYNWDFEGRISISCNS